MGEDDIVELLWKSGQVIKSSQTQRPSAPFVLRGSGSGSEENVLLPPSPHPPLPLLQQQQQQQQQEQEPSHQSLFIQEDEMTSWLYHHNLTSELLYSAVTSTSTTQPQSSISLPPPPPLPPLTSGALYDPRSVENFMHFSRLRENIFTGSRVEVVSQVSSSAIPTSSGTGSSLTPAMEGVENIATIFGGTSRTLVVPCLGPYEHTMAIDTQVKTEPFQIQQATETDITGEMKRHGREETSNETEEAEEFRGTTSRKRSRAAEMHNLSERRRRETFNEKIKTLQEIIPRCSKADKTSVLEDTIRYVKAIQKQVQNMLSMGYSMVYTPDMERFMPHMTMGMMGVNRPPFSPFPGSTFTRPAHMAGLSPSYPPTGYPFQNVQAFDPSRVYLPSQQTDPVSNQPQLPSDLYPYSQFVAPQHIQQPPPPPFPPSLPPPSSHNQTASEIILGQASGRKEPEDHEKKPTG